MDSWGDFCTYCGEALPSGGFPRRCAQGHVTYLTGLGVAVALQPVVAQSRTGLLVVQRGIAPFVGRYALPGGFVENDETYRQAAVRELSEETGITHAADVHVETFWQAVGTLHNSGRDPRKPLLQFETMPYLHPDAIDFSFTTPETTRLTLVFYTPETNDLRDQSDTHVELCFPLHQDAAIQYLKELLHPIRHIG